MTQPRHADRTVIRARAAIAPENTVNSSDMTDNNDIGWMYEGAKSLVNREDYLLGKKVDKNFEKYSDAVNEQKVEALEALLHTRTIVKPLPGAVKTSALESYVVAKEDPLVAVKVKEETRRREVLENPLVKLKFQKMLKEMMAEKESKGGKKDKKKKKKKKRKGEESEKHKKEKKIRKKSRESVERSRKCSLKRRSSQREASSDSSESEAERKPRSEKGCGETRIQRQRSCSPTKHKLNEVRRSRSPTMKGKRRSRSPSAEGKNRRNDSERRSERQDHRRNQRSPARENQRPNRSPGHWKAQRSRDAESPRDRHGRARSRSRSRRSASRERRRVSRSPRKRSGERSSRAVPSSSRGKTKADARLRKRSASSSSEGSSSTSSSSSSEDSRRTLDRKGSKGSKNAFTGSEKPGSSKEVRMEADKVRSYDSHIPEHLRPKATSTESDEESEDMFDREERERKKRFEGFGLVGVKKKVDNDTPSENPYELSRKPAVPVYKKSDRRQPLTEEEKQRKLQEMAENAKWRQDTRIQNLKRSHLDEEKEVEQDMNDKAPSFIRSQLNSAANDLTVEQRLQSKKKSLQRSHGYMEKKFMSK